MEWSGKTALVTGGGSGIGRHLSLALARKKCNVTVSDRHFSDSTTCRHQLMRESAPIPTHIILDVKRRYLYALQVVDISAGAASSTVIFMNYTNAAVKLTVDSSL